MTGIETSIVDVPSEIDLLLAQVENLGPDRIRALAAGFRHAEDSAVKNTRRALARHMAMNPDTPRVIAVLAAQLALSDATRSWEAVFDIGEETAYAARAAVLDMGLVVCVPTMGPAGVEALAEPWLTAKLAG